MNIELILILAIWLCYVVYSSAIEPQDPEATQVLVQDDDLLKRAVTTTTSNSNLLPEKVTTTPADNTIKTDANSSKVEFGDEGKWNCAVNNQPQFWSNPQQITQAYKAAVFSSIVYLSYEKWSHDDKKMSQNANLSLINQLSFLRPLPTSKVETADPVNLDATGLGSVSFATQREILHRIRSSFRVAKSKVEQTVKKVFTATKQLTKHTVLSKVIPSEAYQWMQAAVESWRRNRSVAKNWLVSLQLGKIPMFRVFTSLVDNYGPLARWWHLVSSKEGKEEFEREAGTKASDEDNTEQKSTNVEEYKFRWFLADFHYKKWHDTEVLLAESESSLLVVFRGSDCVADVFTNSQRMFPIQDSGRFPSYVRGNMLRGMYHAYASVDAGTVVKLDGGDAAQDSLLTSLDSSPVAKLYHDCVMESGENVNDDSAASKYPSCHVEDSNLSEMLVETVLRALDHGYEVIVTGHSLGGALAMLLTLDVLTNHRHFHYYPTSSQTEPTANSFQPRTSPVSTHALSSAVQYDHDHQRQHNAEQQRKQLFTKRKKSDDRRIAQLTTSLSIPAIDSDTSTQQVVHVGSIPSKALLSYLPVQRIMQREGKENSDILYQHHNQHSDDADLLPGKRDFHKLYLITFGEPEFADVAFFDSLFYTDTSTTANHVRDFFESTPASIPHYHSYIGVSAAPKCEVDLVSQILTHLSKYIGHQVIGFQQVHQHQVISSKRSRLSEEAHTQMLQDQSPVTLHQDETNEDLLDIDIAVDTAESIFAVDTCVSTVNASHSCDQHLSVSQQKLQNIAAQYQPTHNNDSTAKSNNKLVVLHDLLQQRRIYLNSGYAQNNIDAHSLYNYLHGVLELGRRYNRDLPNSTALPWLQLHADLSPSVIAKLDLVPKKAPFRQLPVADAANLWTMLTDNATHNRGNTIVGVSLQ